MDEWRALLDRHAKVSCALEKTLQDEHGIGLSEFEILDRLVDAQCDNYRMTDLSGTSTSARARCPGRSPGSSATGWSSAACAPTTAAAIFVCLTATGKRVHEQALPTHREVLNDAWSTDV